MVIIDHKSGMADPGSSNTSLEQAHTAALFNKLLKTQHSLLLSEMAKLESLNAAVLQIKQKKQEDHRAKMEYYRQTEVLLQQEAEKKEELLRRLSVVSARE